MTTRATLFFVAVTLLGGCKNRNELPKFASAVQPAGTANSERPSVSATPALSVITTPAHYDDPPTADVGLTVEQAYAAIPHRRTIWAESESTIPPADKAYLKVMFQAVDQAIAVRVAGLQGFSSQQFDSINVDAEFDRLIIFARAMAVPTALAAYHNDILHALSGEQQFFAEWKSRRDGFPSAQEIANHPGVRAASSASRAAYNELISKYPAENQSNKEAFYDYHCALDFL